MEASFVVFLFERYNIESRKNTLLIYNETIKPISLMLDNNINLQVFFGFR